MAVSSRPAALLLAALCLATLPSGDARAGAYYTFTDLGDSVTRDLNNSGQVTGSAPTANNRGNYAFRYSA
jgi:hypothetical protein